MSLKQYTIAKLAVVAVLAITISQAMLYKNYIIAITALALSFIFLFALRGRVKEIIADERDYQIGGKAARIAMIAYSLIAVIIMFVLSSLRSLNPAFEPVSLTLSISICFLLILYAILFRYYYKK